MTKERVWIPKKTLCELFGYRDKLPRKAKKRIKKIVVAGAIKAAKQFLREKDV